MVLERVVDHIIQFGVNVGNGVTGDIDFDFNNIDDTDFPACQGLRVYLIWTNEQTGKTKNLLLFLPTTKFKEDTKKLNDLLKPSNNPKIKKELAEYLGISSTDLSNWKFEKNGPIQKKESGEALNNDEGNVYIAEIHDDETGKKESSESARVEPLNSKPNPSPINKENENNAEFNFRQNFFESLPNTKALYLKIKWDKKDGTDNSSQLIFFPTSKNNMDKSEEYIHVLFNGNSDKTDTMKMKLAEFIGVKNEESGDWDADIELTKKKT